MSDVYKPAAYVIKNGRPEGFRFVISIDGKDEMVKFTNKKYDCPTAAHEAAIEELMKKPQFTQNLQKVDFLAGVAIAKAHMEANRPGSIRGGATTETMKQMQNSVAKQDADAVTEALAKENLVIAEDVDLSGVADGGMKINIGGK